MYLVNFEDVVFPSGTHIFLPSVHGRRRCACPVEKKKEIKLNAKIAKKSRKIAKSRTAHDCSRIARARYARARSRIAKNTGVQQLKLLKYRCAATKIQVEVVAAEGEPGARGPAGEARGPAGPATGRGAPERAGLGAAAAGAPPGDAALDPVPRRGDREPQRIVRALAPTQHVLESFYGKRKN